MATPPSPLRIMVDSNLIIAGIGWCRFPYEVIQHGIRQDFRLVLPDYIITESRKHIARLLPERTQQFEQFLILSGYEAATSPSKQEVDANLNLVRDPKDVPVALAAINAKVDYLVSQDKDITAQDASTKELRQKLNILLPGTFLRQFMGWTSEELEAVRHRDCSEVELAE